MIKTHLSMLSEANHATGTYFQPASLIRLAYIFPISPIPMMPTTASPILAGFVPLYHEACVKQSSSLE